MAWYRCGMNGTYNATTVSRSGAICNYVANVGGVPLSRFIANITPIQEGSGDPSPSNPRPITGWSAVHAYRSGADTTNPDTYTINLGGTYYGGTLNVGTGVLTVTWEIVDLGTLNWISEDSTASGLARVNLNNVVPPLGAKFNQTPLCTHFKGISTGNYRTFDFNDIGFSNSEAYPFLRARTSNFIGKTDAEITALMNGVQLVYELATPVEYQLTPAQLTQLLGENNVWADSGDSEVDFFKIIRT